MRITGLDLSLTSTGLAEWHDGAYRTHSHGRAGKNSDTLKQRANRLDDSRQETVEWVRGADLILVESHTFAARGGSQHDRSGLWWLVVEQLLSEGHHVVEVAPTQIKQFATGKGGAPKNAVMIAAVRRFPNLRFETDDEADALFLVDMARVHHGLLSGFDFQHKALAKVVWS